MQGPQAPMLLGAVEQFKTEMILAERAIERAQLDEYRAQAEVGAACTALVAARQHHVCQEAHLDGDIGAQVFRETSPFLLRSALIDRSRKPRSYAGDYYTIEPVYRDTTQGSERLGRLRGSREQGRLGAGDQTGQCARRGSCWTSSASRTGPNLRAICVTSTTSTRVRICDRSQLGVGDRITFARDNVVRLVRGAGRSPSRRRSA